MAMAEEGLAQLLKGVTIQGRYKLRRALAEGNFGVIFHAEHIVLGQLVRQIAFKVSKKTNLTEKDLKETFSEAIRSAQIYAEVAGTEAARYLLPVYDMGLLDEYDRRGFVVMDLVRGDGSTDTYCATPENMASLLRKHPQGMLPGVATSYMKKLCMAVGAMHGQGIIHRDLKPDNILIAEDGQLRVTDLGLAAKLSAGGFAHGAAATYEYMAPETGILGTSSKAADVYSMGLIFYEILTGKMPFHDLFCDRDHSPPCELSDEEVCRWWQEKKKKAPYVSPSIYNRAIPAWQDKLIARCMSPNPMDRPDHAMAVLEEIRTKTNSDPIIITGTNWNSWFSLPPDWASEREGLEDYLHSWGQTQRDVCWFEAASKLALCLIHARDAGSKGIMKLLDECETLFLIGKAKLGYREQATWYNGMADALERNNGMGMDIKDLREKALKCLKKICRVTAAPKE